MKKYVFVLIMIILATTMYAQESYNKPDNSKFSLEVGFMPFQSESVFLMGEQLRGTLSLNDQIGIRLGLGFASATEKEDDKQADYTKETATISQFSITPGVIYSFTGTNRLTPFVGFELMLGVTSNKTTIEERLGNDRIRKTVITNSNSPLNTFGANFLAGFNPHCSISN